MENNLEEEPQQLLNFVTNIAGERFLKVEEDLGNGYVRLKVAEAERRQAKHDIRSVEDVTIELLRNSRDACATFIFISFQKEKDHIRRITVIDDGIGIPTNLHEKIFEPRVTSKLEKLTFDRYGVHGRGMALFSVKSNVLSIKVAYGEPEKGSVIESVVDTYKLKEIKDQSTFPKVRIVHGSPQVVKGPHNVLRTLAEFSLEYPDLKIYIGSPTEIVATLVEAGKKYNSKMQNGRVKRAAATDKIWLGLSKIKKAKELVGMAKKYLGLEISLRNAHRILSGGVASLSAIDELIWRGKEEELKKSSRRDFQENLTKYLQEEDLEKLISCLKKLLEEIGKKYFLSIGKEPKVARFGNEIKIAFKLEKDEEI